MSIIAIRMKQDIYICKKCHEPTFKPVSSRPWEVLGICVFCYDIEAAKMYRQKKMQEIEERTHHV